MEVDNATQDKKWLFNLASDDITFFLYYYVITALHWVLKQGYQLNKQTEKR